MKKLTIFLILMTAGFAAAQIPRPAWKGMALSKTDLELFHSSHVINLATAETLKKGDLEFEVSHRFVPPVTKGHEALFGADGPANLRLSLAYAATDRLMLTFGRTNVQDNVDVQVKYKAIQWRNGPVPLLVAMQGGGAYNSQTSGTVSTNMKKYQFYFQSILNTLLFKKVGIGLNPAWLENAYIYCTDTQDAFTLGNYIQYYVSPSWSLLAEWIPTVTGWRRYHNTMTLAMEFETGGHFFKILLTNNNQLNTSQVMTGADLNFADRDWRLGFMITRLFMTGDSR